MSGTGDEAYRTWLMSLKVGDEVAVDLDVYRIVTIRRVTRTQLVVRLYSSDLRFRRDTGWQVGEGFARVLPITEDIRAQIRERELRDQMRAIDFHKLPVPVMEKIAAVLQEAGAA